MSNHLQPAALDLRDWSIACLVLCWVALGLRAWGRILNPAPNRIFFLEDFLVFLGGLVFTVSCSFAIKGAYSGLGRAADTITWAAARKGLMSYWIFMVCYTISSALSKASILWTLHRTCHMIHRERLLKKILYVALGINFSATLIGLLLLLTPCRPISHFWNEPETCEAKPGNFSSVFVNVLSIIYIALDIFFVVFPYFPLRHLMSSTWMKKAQLYLLLALSAVGSIVIIYRLAWTYHFFATTDPGEGLFAMGKFTELTIIEMTIVIVGGSAGIVKGAIIKLWELLKQRLSIFKRGTQQSQSVPLQTRPQPSTN